ncbi:hypothetical protein [Halococcus salifodinae]|uniref:hypothetical protein n=2 Tax=Halococcus salifodinae TaxID=36738 RepID=UPI0012693E3A|nr:hypothetical protein [Halococcus salifodinae]
MAETDSVLNSETRRALRRRGRQAGMLAIGAAVAIVIYGVAGVAAILSVPWQLQLGVTVGVTVVIPIAVPYAVLRVYGLSHRDVIFVGKRAYREGVAEATTFSTTRRTLDVFGESENRAVETTENGENPSPDEVKTDESSAESEPTDLQQQPEPEP